MWRGLNENEIDKMIFFISHHHKFFSYKVDFLFNELGFHKAKGIYYDV